MKNKYRLIGAIMLSLSFLIDILNQITFKQVLDSDFHTIGFLGFMHLIPVFMILYNDSIFKTQSKEEILKDQFDLAGKYSLLTVRIIFLSKTIFIFLIVITAIIFLIGLFNKVTNLELLY